MRRTLVAIATATIAMCGPGAAGTANAAEQERQPTATPFGVYISEFATRGANPDGALKEFIEFCNKGFATVDISGQVVASIGTRIISLATIPYPTLLTPGSAYLLASTRFTAATPDQLVETDKDTPDRLGIALLDYAGMVVDTAATTYITPLLTGTPASPLTPTDAATGLSLTRTKFTGSAEADFTKMPATPGRC